MAVAGLARLGAHESLEQMLNDDLPDHLQLQVSLAVLNKSENRDALDGLAILTASTDAEIRTQALDALRSITGYEPDKKADDEKSDPVILWEQWAEANLDKTKLKLPYAAGSVLRGRTLVCYASGLIQEFDLIGNKTWSRNSSGFVTASGLSNGHRLVARMSNKKVIEYDANGKQVWSTYAEGYPNRVYRLENENTLVATHSPGKVLEYRQDGSIAWEYSTTSTVVDARRMDDGNTLVTLQDGKIIKVNGAGKLVWSKSGLSRPVAAQPLPNGNILIALAGQSKVIEVTPDFKTVWSKTGLSNIADAMRLPDGTTIVATNVGVRLYSPKGKRLDTYVPKPKNVSSSRSTVTYSSGFGSYSTTNPQAITRVYRY